jgi:hypothetical protein
MTGRSACQSAKGTGATRKAGTDDPSTQVALLLLPDRVIATASSLAMEPTKRDSACQRRGQSSLSKDNLPHQFPSNDGNFQHSAALFDGGDFLS